MYPSARKVSVQMAMPPLIAGRYVVQAPLGTGAQGEVYRVLDTHLQDVVALKLLTALPGGGHWAEAQILRTLADEHILPIRNADMASGRPYLVTEIATHGTVQDRIAGTGACGLDVDDAVRWTRQACLGVARAHDRRLLHNDVKPMNLFVNAEGECLVGDFGFAALLPASATEVAIPGATAETAAPEIAAAWPAPLGSVRSDVYSLGASAYWMLAARPPIDLSAAGSDPAARMAMVAAEIAPRLRDVAPHLPQYVATAIERAIARDPADRFATVNDFYGALGSRPRVSRRWRRTDEHASHLFCFRGDPVGRGNSYVLCVEQGSRPTRATLTTRQVGSARRVTAGCRETSMRNLEQAIRAVIGLLR
jgi:serine/threonine protein kinase